MTKLPYTHNRGFSLIEVMVVVGLVGLLLAATIPGMSAYLRSSRFRGAVNTLAADFHQARSLSTSERRTYEIRFTSGGYSVIQTASADTLHRRTMPPGVTCAASGTATFFPWGLSTPVDVTVSCSGGGTSRVLSLAANGSVHGD
jgi:prepilin-type N-terminal cleavage/methylation domain-containing protein